MASTRQFYKTTITVELLSEEPYHFADLHGIAHDIEWGSCSGRITSETSEQINGEQCAKLLIAQDSDPEFFQLDADGNDIDVNVYDDDDD